MHTVYHGTETLSFRGPKTWALVPKKIKASKSITEFKAKIKQSTLSTVLLSWAVLQLHTPIYLRIGTSTVGRYMRHMSYEEATPQLLSVGMHTVCLTS